MKKKYLSNNIKAYIILGLTLFLQSRTTLYAQSFSSSVLQNSAIQSPTSLQFGPDGKLYVAQQGGEVKILTIEKNGANNYTVTNTETILLVKNIPNYNDDGTPAPSVNKRLITGLLVVGTADNPIIYVSSSDSRIGAGAHGDVNLCTNSGVISKLTKNGAQWSKVDLVRGLPRSEENHAVNGMQLDMPNNRLLLAIGGSTNAGGVSQMWTYITEYALTAAILSIDLNAIEAMPTKTDPISNHQYKYDVPTLDDPTRTNNADGTDVNDPWGGNDGLNQGKIVSGGPVQVFAPGFRNPYDLVITKSPGKERRLYTVDNGPNAGWGGQPKNEGPGGTVTNEYQPSEPGSVGAGINDPQVNNLDGFEFIGNLNTYVSGSYYGGHPVPVRANPTGAGLFTHSGSVDQATGVWRTSKTDPTNPLPADWPPVPVANPMEGDYQNPGETDMSLLTFNTSTNGICEYTASNFGMQGDILAAAFNGNIYRIKLNATGDNVLNARGARKLNQDQPFAAGLNKPLDVTAQADNEVFPGTVWVAQWGAGNIVVFEPQDVTCTNQDNNEDDDMDGYSNADEIDNSTNPCSGSSKPQDNDSDNISDLNDPDDDNDGITDIQDLFQIDPQNGLSTNVPTHYALFNYDPGTGFFGLGFTGLMSNGTSNYKDLYDEVNLVAGGAAGALTINDVHPGDALKNSNSQQYAFQFGINVSNATGPFTVRSAIVGPFFNNQSPQNYQSQGIFIGTGDQDNYIKWVLNANNGQWGLQVVKENGGVADSTQYDLTSIPNSVVYFYIYVDPVNGAVQPYYAVDGGTVGPLGPSINVSGPLLNAIQSATSPLAVGIISTSKGASPFTASWDFISVDNGLTIVQGIQDYIKTSLGISVYPNPAKDKLFVSFDEPSKASEVRVEVYNNFGTAMKNVALKDNAGQSESSIDISSLPTGVYVVKVKLEKDQKFQSFKLIKQ